MKCGSCASGACGVIKRAIHNKSGGCQSGGCATKGCGKMNNFDWLSNMSLPEEYRFDVVEVKFKGGRKEFFRNTDKLEIYTGDPVVVAMQTGYHIGYVSMQGELVRLQMNRRDVKNDENIRKIYRIATQRDLEKFAEVQQRELPTLYRTREIIREMNLSMKLSDVEFQADNTKATFYYSADERVDFRELIKVLAAEFKIRVDMRQISPRQEAGRLGGIGTCGRELCCSTWLVDFKAVANATVRYQNLSTNPVKTSGQCGRLKCCLNYELDTYLDALLDIPKIEKPLLTEAGEAKLEKVDIFKKILWFSYDTESNWIPITSEQAAEYLKMNEEGKKVPALIPELKNSSTEKKESVSKKIVEILKQSDSETLSSQEISTSEKKEEILSESKKKKKIEKLQQHQESSTESRKLQSVREMSLNENKRKIRKLKKKRRKRNSSIRKNMNPDNTSE
ncbi:MAG: Signal peptidase-like protein [Cytophagales bacterium]|nr:Signal peptidase-like protein [Cytophagales bacterium]MDW8384516.1 regulatory iron-sulfur-containing complex subunit RicT [Flammeovirgaceae bacterium]